MNVFSLETSRRWVEPLRAVLCEIEVDGDIDIEPDKEVGYFRRGMGGYFAVIDNDGRVVGYLSGSMRRGDADDHHTRENDVVAFVRMIAIAPGERGRGAGFQAIRAFARLANEAESASLVTLHLDAGGDRARRQTRFERMGFSFSGEVGLASVEDLLGARRS